MVCLTSIVATIQPRQATRISFVCLAVFSSILLWLLVLVSSHSSTSSIMSWSLPVHADVDSNASDELKIQIASDLHIEFYGGSDNIPYEDIIVPKAPVLALLGDIGLAYTESLRRFLHYQAGRFETVLFLAGNHEYYNHDGDRYSVFEQQKWLEDVCKEKDNIIFMEKTAVDLQGVRILGTSLWSEVPKEYREIAQASMNDYNLCYMHRASEFPRQLTAAFTTKWHRDSVQWLEKELKEAKDRGQPALVLTHHTPSMTDTSNPKYDGSDLNHCFSTNLRDGLMTDYTDTIKTWACGHTHYNFDFKVGNSRLLSNQRGYPNSQTSWL